LFPKQKNSFSAKYVLTWLQWYYKMQKEESVCG
jgi:hypothetical protein